MCVRRERKKKIIGKKINNNVTKGGRGGRGIAGGATIREYTCEGENGLRISPGNFGSRASSGEKKKAGASPQSSAAGFFVRFPRFFRSFFFLSQSVAFDVGSDVFLLLFRETVLQCSTHCNKRTNKAKCIYYLICGFRKFF